MIISLGKRRQLSNEGEQKLEGGLIMRFVKLGMLACLIGLICYPINGFGITKEVPGITDDTIKIGVILPLSGVIANYGQAEFAVYKAMFRDINEKGGIAGRKIKMVTEDSSYEPSKAVAGYLKLVKQDKVFMILGVVGGALGAAISPLAEKDRVPVYHIGPSRVLWDPPRKYYFTFLTSYEAQFGCLIRYLAEEAGIKKRKLAVLYQDDAYGKDGLIGYKKAAKKYGYELVAEIPFGRRETDLSAYVLRAKNAGMNLLGTIANTKAQASIINETRRLRSGAPVLGNADEGVLPLLNKPWGEIYGSLYCPLWHERDKVPGLLRMKALFDKYNVDTKGLATFHFSWGGAISSTLIESFKRMFDSGDIGRDSFVKATESIQNVDFGGMSIITFGPNRRVASDATIIYKGDEAAGLWIRQSEGWVTWQH